MSTSLELFEELSTGHQLTANELDDLVANQVREDQYLEYKHGNAIQANGFSATLREYLSAFANSTGGLLIVGVDAPSSIPTQVTGILQHNRGNLDDWASRCITPIASFFSPLPQFQLLQHPQGDILICVVPRSLGLVPNVRNGATVYHFRFHDQTLQAPDYLLADLLLGRRQNPILELGEPISADLNPFDFPISGPINVELDMKLKFENNGLTWANDAVWGLIAWTRSGQNKYNLDVRHPSRNLFTSIQVDDVSASFSEVAPQLRHYRSRGSIERPFDVWSQRIDMFIPIFIQGQQFIPYIWKAALYILSRDSLPNWYQLEVVVNEDTFQMIGNRARLSSDAGNIKATRLTNRRPVVAWEGL